MDTLMTSLIHLASKGPTINLILMVLGTLLPFLVGMFLSRRNTIRYGGLVYKILGGLMLQKRIHTPAIDFASKLLLMIRSTFVDLSFGIYLESRTDLSKKEKEKKVLEFLTLTQSGKKS